MLYSWIMFPGKQAVTVYICARGRMGDGIAVPEGQKPTSIQEVMAMAMVYDCEGRNRRSDEQVNPENGPCPEDCGIRMIAERRI
jgi:hypothetical protein